MAANLPLPSAASIGPSRRGKTRERILKETLDLKTPVFFNKKTAWCVLGWGRQAANPTEAEFKIGVDALWDRVRPHDRSQDTKKSKKVLALILDALRTFDISDRKWHVGTRDLGLRHLNLANIYPPGGTPRTGPNRIEDAREYLQKDARGTEPWEVDGARNHSAFLWLHYHRYQGFVAAQALPTFNPQTRQNSGSCRQFRAVPVPRGPNSLWHSISYWRGPHRGRSNALAEGRDIFSHGSVKARIWTWFFQAISDPSHGRWRAYNYMQYFSTRRHDDWGELSLARSLCASSRQGLPAYSHWMMLWVIADYFGIQIIVFYPPTLNDISALRPIMRGGLNAAGQATPPRHDTQNYHDKRYLNPEREQGRYKYRWHSFGTRPTYTRDANAAGTGHMPYDDQIFLVTDDWMNYDPAEYDYCALYHQHHYNPNGLIPRGLPPAAPPHPGTFETDRPVRPDRRLTLNDWPEPYRPVLGAAPWDRPPCQQARYNYLTDAQIAGFSNVNNIIPPVQRIYLPEQLNGVAGPCFTPANAAAQQRRRSVKPSQERLAAFEADKDILTAGFKLPTSAELTNMLVQGGMNQLAFQHDAAPAHDLWRWAHGKDPLGLDGEDLPRNAVEHGQRRFMYPEMEFAHLEHVDFFGEDFMAVEDQR
ncbi:hypothetical protein OQA88_9292 [Cercophora sp. LCS_1]